MKLYSAFLALTLMAQTKPPPTRIEPVTETLHGVAITDPYRWLEDDRSPATRAWIAGQIRYARPLLDSIPGREALRKRLDDLLRTEDSGLPWERGGRYFYSKRLRTESRSSVYVRRSWEGAEERLIDPASISQDENTSVKLMCVSPDGRLLAYAIRHGGADETEVRFFDVDAKRETGQKLPPAFYISLQIGADKQGVYYSTIGQASAPIYYRPLAGGKPEPVFGGNQPPQHILACDASDDGRWLIVTVIIGSAGDHTELYVLDLNNGRKVIPLATRGEAKYTASAGGARLYVTTTAGAPKGRVYEVDPERPQRHFWKLVIPEAPHNLEGLTLAGGRLVAFYLVDVVAEVRIFEPGGRHVRNLDLPGPGSVGGISSRWESDEILYSFQSFNYPEIRYRSSVRQGGAQVFYRDPVPFDPAVLMVEQVWFRSKDSTRVPMFIVSRKDQTMDGNRSVLMSGYGGFAASVTPFFGPAAAAWVERGGVYVLVNLRGGAEFGEDWHQAGMRERKQNVFDDFIAAAEWLISHNVTRPEKLAIQGGSNGGLLVGAALTQRPDLFRAVVCTMPLLDMLRYQNFLVARLWTPEYGSAEDAKQFEYLRRYSPYHNVTGGAKYPAVLFKTGDSDTRVAPLHARKMCARLQAASASGLPILLHYDTESGHSGGLPVNKRIADATDILAFLLWQLGEL